MGLGHNDDGDGNDDNKTNLKWYSYTALETYTRFDSWLWIAMTEL